MVQLTHALSLLASVSFAFAAPSTGSGLSKRGSTSCNDGSHSPASLADATSAVNALRARGSENCHVPYAGGANLATVGLATIHVTTVNTHGTILPCDFFAVAAGHILDVCTKPGATTVQGSTFPNDHIEVFISRDM